MKYVNESCVASGMGDKKIKGKVIIKVSALTRKNVIVLPPCKVPYEISCLFSAKSAAFSMGVIMRSTVRKAAKLAVYDEIMINVKNHHTEPTILVEVAYLHVIVDDEQLLGARWV